MPDIVPSAADNAQPTPYNCPGLALPSQASESFPGYVACYRAGHHCPPKVAIRKIDERGRHTTWRCPCCGDFGGSTFMPHEWFDGGAA